MQAWDAMTQTDQIAVASFLFGIFLWFLQWAWTKLPLPGPQPDWSTWSKRLWSVVLAILPGIGMALKTHELTPTLLTAAAAWTGSQAAFAATRKSTPCPPQNPDAGGTGDPT
jgi:hypothetical protein